MPRYRLQQSQLNSCGAAAVTVALAELGVNPAHLVTAAYETGTVYPAIRRGPGQYSAPSKIARYLSQRGLRVWIMEDPLRTVALVALSRGALAGPWLEYSGELWSDWQWRYPRALISRDFDADARALLVVATDGGDLHYLLARWDAGNYWLMDPADGVDYQVNLFALGLLPRLRLLGDYTYTGICIWVAPNTAPWWFRL